MPKKFFNYEAFIEELRPLIKRGEELNHGPCGPGDEEFRRWLREVSALLRNIKTLDYKPSEGVGGRGFGEGAESREDEEHGFHRDMGDTLAELDILVSWFDKFGDPKGEGGARPATVAPVPNAIEPDEQGARTSIAKLRAVQSALIRTMNESNRKSFGPSEVDHYIQQTRGQVISLRRQLPTWYGDFHDLRVAKDDPPFAPISYSSRALDRVFAYMSHVLEVWDLKEGMMDHPAKLPPQQPKILRKVFITHGRSKDWLEVQAHIEKQLGHLKLKTLELAQEASGGKVIIEKLEKYAEQCDSAVIVMSGDDSDAGGLARVRENVMHEIGYFHGKYGRSKVILLHQDGVNVPTNLAGIVYQSYPKDRVSAAFADMAKELGAIYEA